MTGGESSVGVERCEECGEPAVGVFSAIAEVSLCDDHAPDSVEPYRRLQQDT